MLIDMQTDGLELYTMLHWIIGLDTITMNDLM